jgi:hypothetical protein
MYKIIGADQKEYGPISADQIRQWIAEGRVNAKTSICLEGSTEWKPLETYPELASPAASPAISAKPPGVIKVFGILNIVFGGLGLLCSPFSLIALPLASKQLGYTSFMIDWMIISVVLGMAGGVIMLASGIGLLKLRAWARKLAIYYSVFACVMAIISPVLTLTNLPAAGPNPEAQKAGAIIGTIFGLVIGLTYNLLLIFFLSKAPVKEALEEKKQPV